MNTWLQKIVKLVELVKKLLNSNNDPVKPDPVKPDPVKPDPVVFNDDDGCDLVIKHSGREVQNKGQVTYLKRVLTSKPFDHAANVCVQYNDTVSGEVTVWKDLDNKSVKVDELPKDRGIDKIVVWYEERN